MTDKARVRPSLAIGNINPGTVRWEFAQFLLECQVANAADYFSVKSPASMYLDVERNYVTERFIDVATYGPENKPCEYLLFVDSDIVAKPDDVFTLMSYARPDRIISGIYYQPGDKRQPCVSRWTYNDEKECDTLEFIDESVLTDDVDDEGYVAVDACGAGFMAIHRSLLLKMRDTFGSPMPWFCNGIINGANVGKGLSWYGEDYTFCHRALALGVPTFAVPAVTVGHIKPCYA